MQKTAPLIFVSGVHLWVGAWFDAYDTSMMRTPTPLKRDRGFVQPKFAADASLPQIISLLADTDFGHPLFGSLTGRPCLTL